MKSKYIYTLICFIIVAIAAVVVCLRLNTKEAERVGSNNSEVNSEVNHGPLTVEVPTESQEINPPESQGDIDMSGGSKSEEPAETESEGSIGFDTPIITIPEARYHFPDPKMNEYLGDKYEAIYDTDFISKLMGDIQNGESPYTEYDLVYVTGDVGGLSDNQHIYVDRQYIIFPIMKAATSADIELPIDAVVGYRQHLILYANDVPMMDLHTKIIEKLNDLAPELEYGTDLWMTDYIEEMTSVALVNYWEPDQQIIIHLEDL